MTVTVAAPTSLEARIKSLSVTIIGANGLQRNVWGSEVLDLIMGQLQGVVLSNLDGQVVVVRSHLEGTRRRIVDLLSTSQHVEVYPDVDVYLDYRGEAGVLAGIIMNRVSKEGSGDPHAA